MRVKGRLRGHEFEITGGDLALDLVNTKDRRPTPEPVDHLRCYDDLVSWGVQANAIPAAQAAALRVLAARTPRAARATLARATLLREALFDVFSAVALGQPWPHPSFARFNEALPAALARLRLAPGPGGASWTWDSEPHLERVLWPVLRAAALLLTSRELGRLRRCAARDCAWLFLDGSRNGTRRWCDMSVCGNREKARRFQRRAQRRPAPQPGLTPSGRRA